MDLLLQKNKKHKKIIFSCDHFLHNFFGQSIISLNNLIIPSYACIVNGYFLLPAYGQKKKKVLYTFFDFFNVR